jgi:hypothetical protein
MKTLNTSLILLIWFFCQVTAMAQFDPKKICRLENERLIFRLDSQWTDSQKKEVSQLFDLDSLLFVKVFEGLPFVTVDSTSWEIKIIKPGLVEVSKLLAPSPVQYQGGKDIMLIDNSWIRIAIEKEKESAIYGINSLAREGVFQYQKGVATFFLPGFRNAQKVFISGSFNNWSTMQSPMQQTDSGWFFRIDLQPGRYSYKYIIDGKWTPDPFNKLKEDDTYSSYNSIVFCYNYLFSLKGYPEAHTVILCGSFNNWDEKELRMHQTPQGWELPIYLREGTHAYKFKIGRQWITDPANPITRPDGRGNYNSFMAMGDTLIFHLNGFTSAKEVILAGSFNGWNPGELFMLKDTSGWTLPYVLGTGNYEYKFVIDGKWMPDPMNPYSTGSGEYENSFLSYRPNHVFMVDSFPDARQVIVTGSFNNWSTENYRMNREGGKWIFPIWLSPGKHIYKIIADGVWMLDPSNDLWEENEYGTDNSVLWIEP